MADWFPLGSRPEQFEALLPGVPVWMRRDLGAWLKGVVTYPDRVGNLRPNIEVVKAFDQRARRSDPLSHQFEDHGFPKLEFVLIKEQDTYIAFVDYLVWRLALGDTDAGREKLEELDDLLKRCSSEWTVGIREGVPGLEKRVSEGVQVAADAAMASPGHAGTLLSEAWHAAFGVEPSPETAYRKAVLAVEAATIPVVIPTDPAATLGKVFSVMREQKDWALNIKKQHKDYPTTAVLLGMVQMLWAGQGRHAGQPDWAPNTQAEAEGAVMLAVPLVQWFSSGAIARK